jgi:hypothetical protein
VPALRDKLLVGRDYTRYLPIDRWKPKLPTDLELYNHGTVLCLRLEIDMEQFAGRNGILTTVGPPLIFQHGHEYHNILENVSR